MPTQPLLLRLSNISAVPESALAYLFDLASRGLLDPHTAIERRFLTPGFHFTDRGRVRLLQEVVDRWLGSCADPRKPTVAELEKLLASVPDFRQAYDVDIRGDTWTLRAHPPARPLRASEWTKEGWQFTFQVRGRRHFFPVSGDEFLPFTKLFQFLNGSHSAAQVLELFPEHRRLVKRFFEFARAHDLLIPVRRAVTPPRPGVELVSHSSLQFATRETTVLVDPCFVLSGLVATSSRDRRRFEAKLRQAHQVSAVVITHAHWDHAHLPTLFRFRRDTPIFVPAVTQESYYNPALAPLLRSLGFTNVREVTLWKPERIGDVTFTPIPFFGEWFGPGSHFDAFCFLIEINGVRYLGTVDSERDERGNMDQVFEELRRRTGALDRVFFCSSSQTHANPVVCGAPAQYSNGFDVHAELMRYHPNSDAIVRWSRILEPREVIPYAEFIFASTTARTAAVRPEGTSSRALLREYWRRVEPRVPREYRGEVRDWKRALTAVFSRLPPPTRMLMMSPGERLRV